VLTATDLHTACISSVVDVIGLKILLISSKEYTLLSTIQFMQYFKIADIISWDLIEMLHTSAIEK
jgi:hypothetical protein